MQKPMEMIPLFLRLYISIGISLLFLPGCADPDTFRTDAGDAKLPWFQLKPGEFPPEGSAHYIAGELIALDHVNRTGVLRPDRTDAQRRGDWDLPHAFTLLPYGTIQYHGAPAELRDIPIGTHLHAWFHIEPQAKKAKAASSAQRVSLESEFNRCLKLEDDFSYATRLKRSWKIDAVDLERGTLTATGITDGKPDAKATLFQVGPTTRVWKGRGIGTLAELVPGQSIVLNLTVCTLKGPGRCVAIWLDAESRELAMAFQREQHRRHAREHGLAAWIESVDNVQGTVTVIPFAGFDPDLLNDFKVNENATLAVAEDSLRTWDQINDRKFGPLLEIGKATPMGTGDSGVRLKCKPSLLLEGFRPKRIVRVWPAAWKVDDLPREEKLYK